MTDFLASLESVDITKFYAAIPALPRVATVQMVGEGFGSVAVCIEDEQGDQWIVRIARNAETMTRHELEWRMLPKLSAHLPAPIPKPCFRSGATPDFPYGLIGYRILLGKLWTLPATPTVNLKHIVHELADFLSAMHAFPVGEAVAGGVPRQETLAELLDDISPVFTEHLTPSIVAKLHEWVYAVNVHAEHFEYTPRLLHNDLWCENILLSDDLSHLAGVLDFEMMCIGDPVSEFAALHYLGPGFVDAVRSKYRFPKLLEPYFEERLSLAILLRELDGLRYALRYPEADELQDAVEKVTEVVNALKPIRSK